MTFDGWDTQYYGDCLSYGQDSLMHFRTKGSKNGVRRYQMPDGTWTPLGLKERKAREGWGERRAARKEARAERRAARAAERSANLERARQYKAERAAEKIRRNPKKMTDEELKKALARVEMEKQYKEMTKSPLVDTGERLVKFYFNYKANKDQRNLDRLKLSTERMRLSVQRDQAINATKKAKYDAQTAKSEYQKKVEDVKGGLKLERKAQLRNAKTNYRNTTLWGALGKAANNLTKYRQEVRMDPYNAKSAARTAHQTSLANERERLKAEQERQKARQEKWKAKGRKP